MAYKVIIKPSGEWEFQGADSRLQHNRADHQLLGRLGQLMDRVYCVSCGKDGGFAIKTSLFIIYQCEECVAQYGNLPLPRMPDEEEIKWRQGRKD